MIQISQINMPVGHTEEELKKKIGKLLRVSPAQIRELRIVRRSVDARKKQELKYSYTVAVSIKNETGILNRSRGKNGISAFKETSYVFPEPGQEKLEHPPVIVGSGPAGLFCAWKLAKHGYRPILLERGETATRRKEIVDFFWKTGVLDKDCNVQFGEGGAGTFSDGKLNTGVKGEKDKNHRNQEVLDLFVQAGAPENIRYDGRPHLGTDLLVKIVENIRNEIIRLGGTVKFRTTVTDLKIKNDTIQAVVTQTGEEIPCNVLVLAIGHSARDTFRMLEQRHLTMEAKSFAVGVRIEHPEPMITESQYGANPPRELGAANYKLAQTLENGRGVFSFCMCPGGWVVNASSEEQMLAVNGMSYSGRDSRNSNGAIVVSVNPEDFLPYNNGAAGDGSSSLDAGVQGEPLPQVLNGLAFQRYLEARAYRVGEGRVPVQRFADFREKKTGGKGSFDPCICGEYAYANTAEIFPDFLYESLKQGITSFDRKIRGFGMDDALISGVESRTSSPVRIIRDEHFESNIRGIYPCGEGAGYAGGITSAAMDGLKVAEAIGERFHP
ncbi:MAG: NAD(P)/FAD-dependent oxidoreductase [Lachnospiraceae bacterium]|nr:NAD(P)/FAD-dependent oxidoreductase [Lachnospiraceae bacterium]